MEMKVGRKEEKKGKAKKIFCSHQMSQEPRGPRFANEWAGGEPALSRVLWLNFSHPNFFGFFNHSTSTTSPPFYGFLPPTVKMAKTKSGDNISSRLALVMKSGKG
jgi:hypothetical protein